MEYVYIVAIASTIIFLLILFLYLQNNIIDISKHIIKCNDTKGKIRIVQLSDLHSKPFKKVLNITKELKPDIICITGDYINDKAKNKNKMLEFGKELTKLCTVVYITGNHERRLPFFEELMQELTEVGFGVLRNEIGIYEINGNLVNILGMDENQADFEDYKARKNGTYKYIDASNYFKTLEEHKGIKIVLSHFPENFKGIKELNYSQYNFDIQLSGHAHGGQFILPFLGPIYSPGQGLFPKYAKDTIGDHPKLIISRGLGNAEFPFRLFNHPEINVIDITNN